MSEKEMSKDEISNLIKKLSKFLIDNPKVVEDEDLENILMKEATKKKVISSSGEEIKTPTKKKIIKQSSDSDSEVEKVVKIGKKKSSNKKTSRKKSIPESTKSSSASDSEKEKKKKRSSKKKSKLSSGSDSEAEKKEEFPNAVWTLTFGECSENRVGNEQIGKKADEGFNLKDLEGAKKWFEEKGITCELVCLNDHLTKKAEKATGVKADKGYILIARNGLSAIVNPDDMLEEQKGVTYDRKAWMRGKVVNLKARYAICYADKGHKANYEKKEGTVVAFDKMPLLKKVREEIPNIVGKKGKGFSCEGNLYYDREKSYVSQHGDFERMKVFAVRLGKPMKLSFTWFYRNEAISDPVIFLLNHGDIYINSEKAVGPDWKRPSIITLRHAAAWLDKYLIWKPKKKTSTKKKSKNKDSSSESESD